MSEETQRRAGGDRGPRAFPASGIRVFVADDHAAFRKRLTSFLERCGGIAVVGQAGSGDELLARLAECAVDVLCLDVHMPGPGLNELIRKSLAIHTELFIVILTMHDEEQYVTAALREGARGFVLKESLTSRLLLAIRRVCRGETYVDPAVKCRHGWKLPNSRVFALIAMGVGFEVLSMTTTIRF